MEVLAAAGVAGLAPLAAVTCIAVSESVGRRQMKKALRDEDAVLCRLLMRSTVSEKRGCEKEADLAMVASLLSEFLKTSLSLPAQVDDAQLAVLIVHCGTMSFDEHFPSRLVGRDPLELQIKLGGSGLSVLRQSPKVCATTAAAAGQNGRVSKQDSDIVVPFDWACVFLLSHVYPAFDAASNRAALRAYQHPHSLRVRLRTASRRRLLPARELGRADMQDWALYRHQRLGLFELDGHGPRIGAMHLSLEVRYLSIAELCAQGGVSVGQVVPPAGLAEAALSQDIDQEPVMQGIPPQALAGISVGQVVAEADLSQDIGRLPVQQGMPASRSSPRSNPAW